MTIERYEPDTLSKDEAYSLMMSKRRRVVVRLLLTNSREWDVETLAEAVVDQEHSLPEDSLESPMYSRVQQMLAHRDLPKLAAADVIAFAPDDGVILPSESLKELAPLI